MKLRTVLGVGALLLAAAMPATSLGQRIERNRPNGRGYFGGGPFRPSTLHGNGYRNRYRGYGGPVRIGGVQAYFPRHGRGNSSPTIINFNYGYPSYGYGPYGYPGYAVPYGYGYYGY